MPRRVGGVEDATDDLPVERGLVEFSFAGEHEVNSVERALELEFGRDELEPGHELGSERGEPAREAAGGAGAVDRGHVDPELVAVAQRELCQPLRERAYLLGACALLRREHGGGIEERRPHVACNPNARLERPPPERLDRAEPAVGACRAADPDDHIGRTSLDRARDQLAGAARRRRDRIVPLGSARRASPEASAASTTARPPSSRQPASTGLPSGPVTRVVRFAPPSASSVPSPPSASGSIRHSHPARRAPSASARAASGPVSDPRNLSGAASASIAPFSIPPPLQNAVSVRDVSPQAMAGDSPRTQSPRGTRREATPAGLTC